MLQVEKWYNDNVFPAFLGLMFFYSDVTFCGGAIEGINVDADVGILWMCGTVS